MALFVLTYDVRATHHDYTNLYALLNSWRAAHLQNSVWLADMATGTAEAVREAMRAHMHTDDTVSVIQLAATGTSWAAINVRAEGMNWLKARFP
jgi:CRISPR/Cas system-associated endoribonuclease Cas2